MQLDVPFTSQAPEGNWAQPWHDACEETSILMVDRFYTGEPLTAKNAAKGILDIFAQKELLFGPSNDESTATMAALIRTYFSWDAIIVENPTVEDIKAEIDAGHPVLMPSYAPDLRNPHFQEYFPYHVGVISGYNDDTRTFYMEDPGTRYGQAFPYSYETIMTAMHDFVPGDVPHAPQRVIFTRPNSELSGELLIAPSSPKVYLVTNNQKQHIANEHVFFAHGWEWSMLRKVADSYLESIPEGQPLTE